jgi:hypothetical protein
MAGRDEKSVSEALSGQQLANLTGLTRFVAAAVDDALAGSKVGTPKSWALQQALIPLVPVLRDQSQAREGDQAVVDAVIEVMGSAWRPSAFWREQLISAGRTDLAQW